MFYKLTNHIFKHSRFISNFDLKIVGKLKLKFAKNKKSTDFNARQAPTSSYSFKWKVKWQLVAATASSY
jgi:hypothetical protein